MTVISKSMMIKKVPLIHEDYSEEEAVMRAFQPSIFKQKTMLFVLTLMLLTLFILGAMLTTILHSNSRITYQRRFQGFCAVQVPPKIERDPVTMSAMPMSWTGQEVQIFSTFDEATADDLVNSLREELDIADDVEKITVIDNDNGQRVDFVHNFASNVTSIADDVRCFTMELEPELALAPALFVSGLQRGAHFDVSRVRSHVRAALPPLDSLPSLHSLHSLDAIALSLLHRCRGKPLYQLTTDHTVLKRKRSVDESTPDYVQFAGKHIQEIEVNNLADILQYEQNMKNKTD